MGFRYQGFDFIGVDGSLTEEELLVRRSVREFVEERVTPRIEEWFREGKFDRGLAREMGAMGLLGATLEGYGCAGMSAVEYGLAMQELERGDSGVRSFASVQSALVMYPIATFGSEAQKEEWLPQLAKGEAVGCFGLTEPDWGSNPGGMTTRARRVGAEWELTGEKMWITSGSIADVAVVWAVEEQGLGVRGEGLDEGSGIREHGSEDEGTGIREQGTEKQGLRDVGTEGLRDSGTKGEEDRGNREEGGGAGRVRGFLVETGRAGFKATDIHGKWSLRASVTSGLTLEGVRVPEGNLLPGTAGLPCTGGGKAGGTKTAGLKSALMCLNQARYGIAWGALGAAMECYDTALQYAKARKQFHGRPIASHQLVQEKLVWMATEIAKGQLLALQVGRLKDKGRAGHEQISMAKRNNVGMALECTRLAREVLGANGITEDYPVMRHMMNLESVKTYEGTHDIHTLIVGQALTGESAF
jgi:glutaryl-CoA dehydrogenase